MINRNPVKCNTCGAITLVRVGIGHGTRQVHIFPCPACGVPITITMNLDQEKVDFSYEDPINATWANTDAKYAYSVTFHPEVLGPRSAFEADRGSPFVTTPFLFTDYGEYREHEQVREQI